MKKLSTNIFEEALSKLTFPDYESFSCDNEAYFDLTSKMFELLGKVALTKL